MAKSNSISDLTYKLKNIARDIREAIANKGILDRNNVEDDLSLFSGYIKDTIISDFENTLKTTFSYPQSIVDYIYRRFSLGGYYFYKIYQEPYLQNVEGSNSEEKLEKIEIPDTEDVRRIFKTSKITYEDVEYSIAYFPILNLTEFDEINDLFNNNTIVIGLPKVIYDGAKVSTLVGAFSNCWSLHQITLKAIGESPSMVPFGTIFTNCTILEDFDVENIIPTNITGLVDKNDIQGSTLEKLDLTHITSVGSLGYTFDKTGSGWNFFPNLYMPKCLSAENMSMYVTAGCGNLIFGVGCKVNAGTFGWGQNSNRVGIISGLINSVNLSILPKYDSQSVHNWLYSVATDVRTYGHPDDSNPDKVRKLTFHTNAITSYNGSEIKTEDESKIVYIQDTLTDENTLDFVVGDNELDSLNHAISSSTSLKKPLELYNAIYNMTNKKRYYITALEGESVTNVHTCDFTIIEGNKAKLAEGTIFDLMEQRYWEYE